MDNKSSTSSYQRRQNYLTEPHTSSKRHEMPLPKYYAPSVTNKSSNSKFNLMLSPTSINSGVNFTDTMSAAGSHNAWGNSGLLSPDANSRNKPFVLNTRSTSSAYRKAQMFSDERSQSISKAATLNRGKAQSLLQVGEHRRKKQQKPAYKAIPNLAPSDLIQGLNF